MTAPAPMPGVADAPEAGARAASATDRRTARAPSRGSYRRSRRLAVAVPGAALLVLAGYAVAGEGRPAGLAVGATAALTAVGIAGLARFRLPLLLTWLCVGGLAYPFARYPQVHAIVTSDRAFGALVAVSLVLGARQRWRRGRSTLPDLAMIWLAAAFLARSVFTPHAGTEGITLWLDAILVPVLIYFFASEVVTGPEDFSRVAGCLTFAGASIASIGIAERLFGFELATRSQGSVFYDQTSRLLRVSGPYASPDVFGLVLVCCFAATAYWTVAHRHLVVGTLSLSLETVGIALCFFRAVWIAAVLVVVLFAVLRPQKLGRAVAIAGVTLVLGVAVFARLDSYTVFSTRVHNQQNVSGRYAVYRVGFALFTGAPAFGVGVDQFVPAEGRLPGQLTRHVRGLLFPHSSYMWVLAEQGVWGFLPLAVLTFAGWRTTRRARRRATTHEEILFAAALAGVALGYLFVSLTLTVLASGPVNALMALWLGCTVGRLRSQFGSSSLVPEPRGAGAGFPSLPSGGPR